VIFASQPQVDWSEIFGNARPVEIEIGSGKGAFLLAYARQHPETNLLAIENQPRWARWIGERLVHAPQENVRVLCADAALVVSCFVRDGSVRAYHLYFPDPWWKRRHRKRRLMRELFVHDIERVLQPGGKLHFWTDVEEYFQITLKLLAAETKLEGPFEVPGPPPESADYRTHFERRTRLEGQPVYRSEFRKQ
jgi:tRNA (guanine-N7-)-methyltransferase